MRTRQASAAARQRNRLLKSLQVVTTRVRVDRRTTIFAQGDRCAGLMHIDSGRVQLSVMSSEGRTAVVGVLQAGDLFGEGALAGQRRRKSTAEAISRCTITILDTGDVRRRLLQREAALQDWIRSHLLASNARIEQHIVDQILNRTEKRLAKALLLLAGFDEHQLPSHQLPVISRNLLAEMTGTTRATVDRLMNSFLKRGFLERQTRQNGGLQIHRSMMSVVLQG
jgi:CRP/FNR family transcriptional regulator, cyclic AMP receptor protein